MALADLTDWLNDHAGENFVWFVKRLSANDTLATMAHQAGPYIPKDFLFSIFPVLDRIDVKNPDHRFDLYIDSHADHRQVRAVYYNTRRRGEGTRDESRLTNFGGSSSALLDPDSTGALTVFAFTLGSDGTAPDCHVWVCRHATEEDLIEDRIGPVEPGKWTVWSPAAPTLFTAAPAPATRANCWLDPSEIPPPWLTTFPSGAAIILKTVELRPDMALDPDKRLMRRRECEYEIFRSVEEAVELPAIKAGFTSVEAFIARAQTILQRRKARSGRSLELHTREIFIEEKLQEGDDFDHQPESDPGKRPDFLFPSETDYKNTAFPDAKLRMLAVKTTCKDRWRQILNEADRIAHKHLLTLQEGVSENQFREMTDARVHLVVPAPLVSAFPKSVQPHLQTLESFIGDVRLLRVP